MPLPPRRVTHEHEAAHGVFVRMGGGIVFKIGLKPTSLGPGRASLGRAEWTHGTGGYDCLLGGVAAGPAQTQITVDREKLNQAVADDALTHEGHGFSETLTNLTGKPNLPDAAVVIIRPALPAVTNYLGVPAVQAAVQRIADELEAAEKLGVDEVDWATLEPLVDWTKLPPVPKQPPPVPKKQAT